MPSTLINNIWQEGRGKTLRSYSPDESKLLWDKTSSSPAQVEAAIASAKNAFPAWRALAQSERDAIVEKFASLLQVRKDSIANAIADETGKPQWEALGEVTAMANKVAISIRAREERAGERQNKALRLFHRPHGVMAVFGPYNFPGHLPNGHIVPALLAGNCVVFKPSELTPLVAELTVNTWLDAGLPAGVINLVQGGREVGETLVKGEIDGLLFTGSCQTGKLIHQQLAGRPEVLVALEMGGNNPMIVGKIDNLDLCANVILHSAFLSAGQRCTCTRRLILVKSDKTQPLLEKLIAQAQRVILNTPAIDQQKTPPFMGPLIHRKAAQQVNEKINWLEKNGGQVLLPAESHESSEVYLSPAIVDVSQVANNPDDETFGPLLQVSYAENFEQALAMANATQFGLAAGLLSDDENEKTQFIQTINAGVISINSPTAGASSELPFGGIGASGNHRPSAYYAADYCAWPQATTLGEDTQTQAQSLKLDAIRGLR